jgi:hypothetical protein
VIPPDFRVAALVLGALLFLAAVLSGVLRANAIRTTFERFARTASAVGGVVLMVWALASYLSTATQRAPPAPRASLSAHELVRAASTALEACSVPNVPAVPNGSTASLEEMEATSTAFKAYDAATREYTQCVDSAVDRIAKQSAALASAEDLQALNTFGARAHNVALDKEQANVDQFNEQLRDYKARHGK